MLCTEAASAGGSGAIQCPDHPVIDLLRPAMKRFTHRSTLVIWMPAVKSRTTSLGVMPGLNDDMSTRSAPLEYWFARLDTADLSFLVDFIVRRRVGTAEIRVSAWIRGRGRVARTVTRSWTASGANVTVGDDGTLTADKSRGRVNDIGWDLTWDVDEARVAPRAPL